MAFVLSGFEHSVANMYYFSIGLMAKSNSAYAAASHAGEKIANLNIQHIIGNLVPVTLGNIIGGFLCVGVLYWSAYKYIPGIKERSGKTLNR
jgi:formate/nitrite transporter FocA (FNT family)